jgi:hypothetical protein
LSLNDVKWISDILLTREPGPWPEEIKTGCTPQKSNEGIGKQHGPSYRSSRAPPEYLRSIIKRKCLFSQMVRKII